MLIIINEIINWLNENPIYKVILIIVLSIILISFIVNFLAKFLQSLEYLALVFKKSIVKLFKLILIIFKLIIKILFFPIYLIFLIRENKRLNKNIVNNSYYKEVLQYDVD